MKATYQRSRWLTWSYRPRFAFMVVPVLLGSTFVVYFIRKDKTEDIADRCIKMALTGLFLSEPNTSSWPGHKTA
jgi:hypothetical protein